MPVTGAELTYNVNATALQMAQTICGTHEHPLFGHHQIAMSKGLASESLHPGQQTLTDMPQATSAELADLLPVMNPETGARYGRPPRRPLRGFGADALVGLTPRERAA